MADTQEAISVSRLPAIISRPRWRGRSDLLVVAVLIAAVGWLVAVPLGMVVWGSLRDAAPGLPGELTFNNFVRAYNNVRLIQAIGNSLIFAGGAAIISFLGGTFLAWVTERTDAPLRRLIYALVLVPVIVPGILFASSWLFLLNPTVGILNKFAEYCCGLETPIVNGYSMAGMIWAQGVDNFSLPFLLMAAAFRSMDPSLEEAAQVAGAGVWGTMRTVTLPVLLPSVLATLLISFIRALESFEVPAVMGIPAGISVFATEVWLALSRRRPPDFNLSATFAMGYFLVTIIGRFFVPPRDQELGKVRHRNRQRIPAQSSEDGPVAVADHVAEPVAAECCNPAAALHSDLDFFDAVLHGAVVARFIARLLPELSRCVGTG